MNIWGYKKHCREIKISIEKESNKPKKDRDEYRLKILNRRKRHCQDKIREIKEQRAKEKKKRG